MPLTLTLLYLCKLWSTCGVANCSWYCQLLYRIEIALKLAGCLNKRFKALFSVFKNIARKKSAVLWLYEVGGGEEGMNQLELWVSAHFSIKQEQKCLVTSSLMGLLHIFSLKYLVYSFYTYTTRVILMKTITITKK